MQFFKTLLVGASALFTAVAAQSTTLTFTRAVSSAQVGQNVVLQYKAPETASPVTILLRKGPANNLQTVATVTNSATGGSYAWTVPNVPSGSDYALEIMQGSQVNYFGPLSITGGTATSSSSMSGYLPNPMPSTTMRTLTAIPSGSTPVPVVGSSTPVVAPTMTRPRPHNNGQNGQVGNGGGQGGAVMTSATNPINTGAASLNKGHAGLAIGLVGAIAAFA